MSKFELLKQTLLGNLEEKIPISIWKHHPKLDRTPEGLAEEEIAFHREFDHDLMKISFHGRYPVVDWGCVAVYDGAISGSTTCQSCVVQEASDWETLEPLDVNSGEFGKQIHAIELIQKYTQDKVPIMATVFDAPMVADKLSEKNLTEYMETNPEIIESVLEMINGVMVEFGKTALETGADGLFIASQHSTQEAVTDEQYKKFVYPFDFKMIEKFRGRSKFIILHLHAREENEKIRYKKIANTIGVDGINWEDQSTALTLKQGKNLSRKAVFGGIDHNDVLRNGSADDAKEQVLGALREAGLRRTVVAPGCVITVDTPRENINAIVNAVRSIDPWSKEWED
ncbi:MAG: uroporphyrinogen decarboxylase family protein [Candidatus Thorarchaeota archaeon]|jgi:uroporphyrinogen decarboxylase